MSLNSTFTVANVEATPFPDTQLQRIMQNPSLAMAVDNSLLFNGKNNRININELQNVLKLEANRQNEENSEFSYNDYFSKRHLVDYPPIEPAMPPIENALEMT